jgi:putative hydrolase of the HAD superfamily
MPVSITAVIFDFGGVLGLPQDPARVAAMAELCGLSQKDLLELYRRDRLELDRGMLTSEEYWGRIMSHGDHAPTPELVARIEHEDTLGWTRVNKDMVRWVTELRAAGLKTAILSNMPSDKLSFIRKSREFSWVKDFDTTVFSCDHALVKPEPAIYRLCLERLGVQPGETLFLDDAPVNIKAALALGMNGLLFASAKAAADELRSRWRLPVAALEGRMPL